MVGLIYEGFETGNFLAYLWQFSGNQDWEIDDSIVYEGVYSARSGPISDNQNSNMEIEICFLADDNISFFQKVSSELNWDYLRFYIDEAEYGSWSGEQDWGESNYPVTKGVHTIKWTYEKDWSVSNGSDCAWVDNITFPALGDLNPQLTYSPASFDTTLSVNDLITDTITLTNEGTAPLTYIIEITDNFGNSIDWLYTDPMSGLLNYGITKKIALTFDMNGMAVGDYEATITLKDHIENEYTIPVMIHVDINTGKENNNIINNINYSFPNPFTHETTIYFSLKEADEVTIEVFDFKGQKIKRLLKSSLLDKGTYSVNWDASSDKGYAVEPGIYYYRITIGEEVYSGKMVYMQ